MVILIFLKDLFDQKRLLKSAYLEFNNMKQVAHKYLRYTLRALVQKIQIHIHLIKERERLTEITSVIDLLNNSNPIKEKKITFLFTHFFVVPHKTF